MSQPLQLVPFRRNSQALLPAFDKAVALLLPLCLVIDWLNGLTRFYSGADYAISAGYKALLLALLLAAVALQRPRWVFSGSAVLLLMLLGPSFMWPAQSWRWVFADTMLAVKALAPLLLLAYLYLLTRRNMRLASKILQHTLWLSTAVLLLNALLGLAGLGGSAYQPLDGVAQAFLGIKGFFSSTNELSAVLLVLSAALLAISWPISVLYYSLISLGALALALLLLTKTGIFGCSILIILVPLLHQPKTFWLRHRAVWLTGLAVVVLLIILLIFNGKALLQLLGIFDKLQFVYQQRGVTGILLSSRDYYAGRIWQLVQTEYPWWQQLLGVGQGEVALQLKKYFAELDWFDLFIFHGLTGFAVWLVTFALFFRICWQRRQLALARQLMLLNSLLLLVSAMAGHVLTSGMLWPVWALVHLMLLKPAKGSVNERPV